MLLCDDCDTGYHLGCLNPPLKSVPSGSWYCPKCARKKSKKVSSKRKRGRPSKKQLKSTTATRAPKKRKMKHGATQKKKSTNKGRKPLSTVEASNKRKRKLGQKKKPGRKSSSAQAQPKRSKSHKKASPGPSQAVTSEEDDDDSKCIVCGSGKETKRNQILLCDGLLASGPCPSAYHQKCLSPVLNTIPSGDWYCPSCRPA